MAAGCWFSRGRGGGSPSQHMRPASDAFPLQSRAFLKTQLPDHNVELSKLAVQDGPDTANLAPGGAAEHQVAAAPTGLNVTAGMALPHAEPADLGEQEWTRLG